MRRVILDTNFLMIPGSLGVDIFSELQRVADFSYVPCAFDKTLAELKRISEKGRGKHALAARIGLQLVQAKGVKVLESYGNSNVDDLIVESAQPGVDIVATQDRELKRRLKAKGVALIVLRKKKFLNIA